MLIACHCEGRGWKFWGDSNLRSKFRGQSIQLDPLGVLTLEFDDGEIFQWSKVTTTIYNLILGKVYCNHHGTMNILGNRQYSCKLKLKEQSFLDRNPRQVRNEILLHFLVQSCQVLLVTEATFFYKDQRYLENGEYEKANAEKLRLEKRQRMCMHGQIHLLVQSRKLQENGWKPRWFHRDSEDATYCYIGGYWEAREQQKWDDCMDIFGEYSMN
ncbi:hypothetical protein GW17_00010195 [Ensete ventricosum]|nr:hypothetical protein GW17_00010195 [Ensete ventricosum]